MDRPLQIIYYYSIFLFLTFLSAEEKWKYSADLMEADKINNDLLIQKIQLSQQLEESSKKAPTDASNNCCYCSCNTSAL